MRVGRRPARAPCAGGLEVRLERGTLGGERLPLVCDVRLFGLERRVGGLELGRQRFGVFHLIEHAIFVAANLGLGGGHLFLHRLVFLVRLDLHQLPFELGQAPLDGGELLLDVPPAPLTDRDPLLDGLHRGRALRVARVEGLLREGNLLDSVPDPVEAGVEFLEMDKQLEFRRHQFSAGCRLQIADCIAGGGLPIEECTFEQPQPSQSHRSPIFNLQSCNLQLMMVGPPGLEPGTSRL